MKAIVVIAALMLLMLGLTFDGFAQKEERPARLSTAALSRILGIVLRAEFKPSTERKVVYLRAPSIRENSLPHITNTEFILIDAAGLERIGKAYLFNRPMIQKGKVRVDFGYGSGCNASGGSYFFRIRGSRVTRTNDFGGWGTGCGSGTGTGH